MSTISLVLLSFLCYIAIFSGTVLSEWLYTNCFDDKGNYTDNSAYPANLNVLLSNITTGPQINKGFYSASYGQYPDTASVIALCRGDVKPGDCRSCMYYITANLPQSCPYQKEAMGGYNNCMLRYSNRSISEMLKDDFWLSLINPNTPPEADRYKHNQVVRELLERLTPIAAGGDSLLKFAAANETGPHSQTVYGLVQCYPDLSKQDCNDCLTNAISKLPQCCEDMLGGRVIKTSCNFRYENDPFVNLAAGGSAPAVSPLPPPTNIRPSKGKRDIALRTTFIIVVPIVIIATLFGLCCYFLRRTKRKRDRAILKENFGEESSNLESLRFNLATIEAATNKFSNENRIGQGGFGEVYKGILPNGQEIAVKRLSKNSGQGTVEFKNEVLLIAKLQHRNLVTLQGFCLEDQEKILIYEYVPNKSIDFFLFDSKKRREFNWSQRFKILRGIAGGLLYLHEHSRLKVIHRDLKPSNILLDNDMNPKISDFGLAKMIAIDHDQGCTNRIVGTYGYMSPEYATHGQFSEKSDIFSYGVIVLEIISGRRNSFYHNPPLLSDAWRQWHDETPLEILDPFLIESGSQTEAIKCLHIGLLCVQANPHDRPTMTEIVSYLSNLSTELPFPREPAFFIHGRENHLSSGQSSQISKPSSSNEMSKSEFLPR